MALSETENCFYEAIPCGSFRRMREFVGDIDILITRKDEKERDQTFMPRLVQILTQKYKILTDHLTRPKESNRGTETYMGVCKVLHKFRRIDIKFYPRE